MNGTCCFYILFVTPTTESEQSADPKPVAWPSPHLSSYITRLLKNRALLPLRWVSDASFKALKKINQNKTQIK